MGRMDDVVSSLPEEGEKNYPVEIKFNSGTTSIFRIIEPTDEFVMFHESWFLCDDDKIRSFTIENETEGPGILARILGDKNNYYKGGYLESVKGDGGKTYIHQAKDPELFTRINEYYNPSFNGKSTAKPSLKFAYNAIHRDTELIDGQIVNWCVQNKRMKLLKVGQKAFAALKAVKDGYGELNEYDISYTKSGTGSGTTHNIMKAGPKIAGVVSGAITEEELKYEKNDLQYVAKLSSAKYILEKLGTTIQRIDNVMGSSFYQELLAQKEIEDAEWEKRKAEAEASQGTEVPAAPATNPPLQTPSQTQASAQDVQGELPVQPQPARGTTTIGDQPTPENPFDDSKVPIDTPQETQQAPNQTKAEQPVPVRGAPQPTEASKPAEGMEECKFCKKQTPVSEENCVECGKMLRMPCDDCGFVFSIFDDQCPSCKKNFTAT